MFNKVCKFLDILPDSFNNLSFPNYECALWALYYLTDSEQNKIKNFMKLDMIGCLVNIAKENNTKIKIPALRVLGNVTSSDDQDVSVKFSQKINE